MRKPYLKNRNKLVSAIEPVKIRDNSEQLIPKFGLEKIEEEAISHLSERE